MFYETDDKGVLLSEEVKGSCSLLDFLEGVVIRLGLGVEVLRTGDLGGLFISISISVLCSWISKALQL